MKYYISCDYTTTVGYRNDEGDGSEWSSFNHEVRYNHKFKFHTQQIDYPEVTIETDIDNPCMVVVFYSDGGTFGRTDGYTELYGPFDITKAKKLEDAINSGADHKALDKIIGKESTYYPWFGYFSSLENTMIISPKGY